MIYAFVLTFFVEVCKIIIILHALETNQMQLYYLKQEYNYYILVLNNIVASDLFLVLMCILVTFRISNLFVVKLHDIIDFH